MKIHKLLAVVLIMAASTKTLPLLAQNETKEQLTIALSDPGKPGSLNVKLIRGSIHVTGYAGKEVLIDVVSKASAEKNDDSKDENAKGLKRITTGRTDLDLTVEEQKNNVSIKTSMGRHPIHLTIKVPVQFGLQVGTINEGDVTVDNVSGELEISNVNGAIQLTNISGSIVANTVNGNLKAVFKSVNPEAPMAFSTLNGNVDVTFPAASKFDVKLKSDRGEIYSDFDVDVDKTQPKATRSAKDGLYKVSISDWVQGKVNGGGKEVMMKNMNGNIYVRKAK
ncbi:DUF4097 family beta strand repeat-containing protein [Dyadobacter sp. LHD-138]|uniref:DUF4097 family beta strand repeat-containing protein n=1 Tax=Dyadobacter sp. LHD-138 TaxID=3071413 RepID=UPI0027E07DFC|nr:DUF4097 family beta strand repeat-containing protein [Dyadobacter sp. LHD-138]MDQ6481479.1 DUF4097 family beta strand repeat-containing protein [Dyadobacter sp. LHD-138]